MKTASELDIPARPWVPDLLAIATVFIIMLPIAMLNGTYTGSMVEVSNTLGVYTEDITIGYYAASTLSKILCKWEQDSVVSLFLYLDSVFKNKHKLIHNQAPVMNRLCPFLLNLHK